MEDFKRKHGDILKLLGDEVNFSEIAEAIDAASAEGEDFSSLPFSPLRMIPISQLNDFIYDFIKAFYPIFNARSKEAKDIREKFDKEEGGNVFMSRPILEKAGNRLRFQQMLQAYIERVPLAKQLEELNEIQKVNDFVIVDPNFSKMVKPMEYGLADLYNFLGVNLVHRQIIDSGKAGEATKGFLKIDGSTFYAPITYPIPDEIGNVHFAKLLKTDLVHDPSFMELIRRYDPDAPMEGIKRFKKRMGGGKNPKIRTNGTKIIDVPVVGHDEMAMLGLVKDVWEKSGDISYMSQFIEGQERPMRKFIRKNLDSMLASMQRTHAFIDDQKKKMGEKQQRPITQVNTTRALGLEEEREPIFPTQRRSYPPV